MQVEITGKIVNVLPTQSGQGKNGEWVKNLFVIEWQDNGYKQLLCLEVNGAEKFEKMKNAIKVGYDVLCKFSVSSREYKGRWYTSCSCFYCSNVGGQQRPVSCGQQQTQAPAQAPQQPVSAPQQQEESDDLPF